jgi:hypothetical protein
MLTIAVERNCSFSVCMLDFTAGASTHRTSRHCGRESYSPRSLCHTNPAGLDYTTELRYGRVFTLNGFVPHCGFRPVHP